jgi:hypothetical protein
LDWLVATLAELVAWWEESKTEIALENGNAGRDNIPDLPLEKK